MSGSQSESTENLGDNELRRLAARQDVEHGTGSTVGHANQDLVGPAGEMRRAKGGVAEQGKSRLGRLLLEDVDGREAPSPVGQRVRQLPLVDDPAARCVEQRERRRSREARVLIGRRELQLMKLDMHRHDVDSG